MKRSSNRLVLLVGLFLAVVAFVLIAVMFSNGGPNSGGSAASPVTTAKVVIAAKDIALGSRITPDMVTTKDISAADKPVDSYADVSLVIGQTARQVVTAQQLITSGIINGTSTATSITVPAGYVAIAVQVSQVTGVGLLIKPGDRVDVVTSFGAMPLVVSVPQPSAKPGASATPAFNPSLLPYNPTTVKTIVEGLQVLGTILPPPAATASGQPQGGGVDANAAELVFLAATTQQAEAIRFAQSEGSGGTIALLLRSAADCQAADGTASACPIIPTTGITLRKMVDDFGVLPPQVVEVLMPTPYPSPFPARVFPSPSPSPSPVPSGSTKP